MYFAGESDAWKPKQLFIAKEDLEVDINEFLRDFRACINVFCKKTQLAVS
jgi:hypothetical protein